MRRPKAAFVALSPLASRIGSRNAVFKSPSIASVLSESVNVLIYRRSSRIIQGQYRAVSNNQLGGNSMKQPRFLAASIALVLALLTGIGAGGPRAANAQDASSLNMRLVGTNDLQARSTYQPALHKYPVRAVHRPPRVGQAR